MSPADRTRIRAATAADSTDLLRLWAMVFDEDDTGAEPTWMRHARAWFTAATEDRSTACFPVIEVDGDVVATAVATLEIGPPGPHCRRGRTVRLANVITVPEHRGRGYGTLIVRDVIEWARTIDADRVDLSATPDGQRIYESVGFRLTTAPRMKLVL